MEYLCEMEDQPNLSIQHVERMIDEMIQGTKRDGAELIGGIARGGFHWNQAITESPFWCKPTRPEEEEGKVW